jgi:hypothetical protein
MLVRSHVVVLAALVSGFLMFNRTDSLAGDCTFLGKDPMLLRDGELLYLPPGGKEWTEVLPSSTSLVDQTIDFAYVIQEKIQQARAGVAIVKSGRFRQLKEPNGPPDARIDLVRNTLDADPAVCPPVPPSMSTTVLARSYDDYHDHGLQVSEQATLDSFHYPHAGRNGSCNRTDLATRDARSRRTNLGQFSFDPDVVNGKAESQLASYFNPTRAIASPLDKLADRRVEIQAYRVRTGFPSCVRFSFRVPAKSAFVRINDLEGLKQEGRYYVRSDEISWTLSGR